jgi:hypothetical protein
MRIQHFPPQRVPRSRLHKGAFYYFLPALLSDHSDAHRCDSLCGTTTLAASHAFCLPFTDSITAPKYKKSSTRSTMTALHVAPPPRAPLHVDDVPHVFLAPMTLPIHEHDHTPLIIGPNFNSIISMGSPSRHHHTTLPPTAPTVRLVTHTYTQRPNEHDPSSMCI